MAEFINPFDFKKIFLEYFLGSTELAMFAFIILFSGICAKYQMSNIIYLFLLLICSLIFAAIIGQALYIIIILVVGFVAFKSLGRILT